MDDLPLMPSNWKKEYLASEYGAEHLTVMSWNARGALYSRGNIITSSTKEFLTHVADVVQAQKVNVMWLNDTHSC